MLYIIDVSSLLTNYIPISYKPLRVSNFTINEIVLDNNETKITIPDYSCNETNKFIDINKMSNIEELSIGEHSFKGVLNFNVHNLPKLKKISIGFYSFTTSCNPNPQGSFNVSNCEKLEKITLEPFTFSHYLDCFTLKDLPCLQYLRIGKIGSYSLNFYWASFCLKGIYK